MKILLVSEYFPRSADCEVRGGVEARAFYIARELARTHEVHVLCAREPDEPVEEQIAGVHVRRCGPVRPYSQAGSLAARAAFLKAAIEAGRRIDADLVDGYNFLAYVVATRIAHARSIPRIATYHDVWLGEWIKNLGLVSGVLGEITERYVLAQRWDQIIAVSEATRTKLAQTGQAAPVDVVYNGISLEDFARVRGPKYEQPTICYVGRLVRYKRVDDLLHALVEVRKIVPDVRLKIVGSGPDSELLKGLSTRLGLDHNVEFLGFVQKHRDVLEVMVRSQMLCLPSSVEGFGMAVIEAMACGTPVVASALAPIREITREGQGALLFPSGNVPQLAAHLTSLLTDKTLHAQRTAQALALAADYDWTPLAKKTEGIYARVLA